MNVSIFDPTGNITALVETPVPPAEQPASALEIMRMRPAVEQVGFLTEDENGLYLRMAGGEFCGNAAMSAAALALLRRGAEAQGEQTVRLRVSGADAPVEVRLRPEGGASFRAGVHMPPAREIRETVLEWNGLRGALPLVWMQGISHLIIEPDSVFWKLPEDRSQAERAAKRWCHALGAAGLGLMFLDLDEGRLTPLVYVPGSDTLYWENACASGTAAAGMALSAREGRQIALTLAEPGGSLRVLSDAAQSETFLFGRTRLAEQWN